jgi:hypothetical protein
MPQHLNPAVDYRSKPSGEHDNRATLQGKACRSPAHVATSGAFNLDPAASYSPG